MNAVGGGKSLIFGITGEYRFILLICTYFGTKPPSSIPTLDNVANINLILYFNPLPFMTTGIEEFNERAQQFHHHSSPCQSIDSMREMEG
jgi:hypothetical protein